MSRASSISNDSSVGSPFKCSIALECRHSYHKSRDSAVSGLRCTSIRKQLPNDFGEDEAKQTYNPLHQSPQVTVSSADGTMLWADAESDSQRNAAAQTLFRELERKNIDDRLSTLDDRMDKFFGTLDLDLEIKDMNTLNSVDVTENRFETQSMHGVMEGNNNINFSGDGQKTYARRMRTEVRKKRK